MTRVLIVTSYFWPDRTGVAVYSTGLARHLAKRGDEVTVLTGMPHYPSWRSGPAGPTRHEDVRIVRHRHYVPRRQSVVRRAVYEAGFLVGGLRQLPRVPEADVVLGVSPCVASARVALAAGQARAAPTGIVFQDVAGLAATQVPLRGGRWMAGPVSRAELSVARAAAGVGLTSTAYRSFFETGGVASERIHDLRNWVQRTEPEHDRQATRARLGWGEDEFVCLHAGNMGRKQGLRDAIGAAARLQAAGGLRLVLAGDGNERPALERHAARVKARNVSFEGVQAPGAHEAMLGAADALLVSQRASVRNMSLPSKLTSYCAAGRPIIAAVRGTSAAAEEVRRAGGMVVAAEDPAALETGLRELMRLDSGARRRLGQDAAAYARTELDADRVLPSWTAFVDELAARSDAPLGPVPVA